MNSVLRRNSIYAHSENKLLAMLCDNRKHIRELSIRKILVYSESPPLRTKLK